MYHPLLTDTRDLKDQDLENRIIELGRKYGIAARLGQGGACQQIIVALEMYKDEQRRRQSEATQGMLKKENKGLDDLINVN
jgi:hypothetical protein